jgi:carnitine O-acetyltransferase
MYRRLAMMKNYTTASSVGTRIHMIPGNASKAMASRANSTSSSSGLKKWPAPMVESNGDYREEAFLETHIGGPLYANQRNLPRLPVPNVKDTLKRFLPTALPLAESEEEKKSLEQACKDFPREAEQLQRRLEARSDATTGEFKDSSWLQHWWNTAGYLQVRDTVVINVSYYFHFSDDGTLPDTVANVPVSTTDMRLGVQRAASLVASAAEFRHKVCSGTLPCEALGRKEPKTPLCSTAYKYMFHACRIPQHEQDSYRIYDPSNHRHCIVACRGHFFALDFLQENGVDPLPLSVLEARFSKCVELANAKSSLQGDSPLLGWLTSMDRDSWADARSELLRTGGFKMEEALSVLESGAFVVCLDNEVRIVD